MIPQLSATSIRQAMRWARDERRLSQACQAVLEFMQRHPIAATRGRSDLASSDMMSMETTKRVWQARLDPRRITPSIGIYSHVKDRLGIFHAQPFVLNERQAGVAIEGVIRQEMAVAARPGLPAGAAATIYTKTEITPSRAMSCGNRVNLHGKDTAKKSTPPASD